jgi:hypothetical protein
MAIAAAPGCGFSTSAGRPGTDAGPGDDDAPGGTGGDDGGTVTPPPGNTVCYGPSGWQVCLGAAPTGPFQLDGAFDTGQSTKCLTPLPDSWMATQPDACIVVASTVMIGPATVTGPRPLVLVGAHSITVTSLLDAASRRMTSAVGAGAAPTDCKAFPTQPVLGPAGGGGAGGSFTFPGADGGKGDGVFHAGGSAATADVGAPTRLRGGCSGQPGGGESSDAGKPGAGGAGGGAVYLLSGGEISFTAMGKIDVSGAGGGGGNATEGGGGGGSGGMLVMYGLPITTQGNTVLIANGGGGGGGGAVGVPDPPAGTGGGDPSLQLPIVAAAGGPGGIVVSQNGGNGGAGFAVSVGVVAIAVLGGNSDTGAGGGGGGGGAGYIRANQDLKTAVVSPAADIKP